MKLLYPKKLEKLQKRASLQEIPSKFSGSSGYELIALAQEGFELYVAFTNPNSSGEVWIEKASILNTQAAHLTFEMLQRIDNDKEFVTAHQFFITKGLLDDIYQKKS